MGTWGNKPLENDDALDLKGDFEENNDISILTNAIVEVADMPEDEYLELPEASEAVAAAEIIRSLDDVPEELLEKSKVAVKKVLDKSELRELWEEAGEFNEWLKATEHLLS